MGFTESLDPNSPTVRKDTRCFFGPLARAPTQCGELNTESNRVWEPKLVSRKRSCELESFAAFKRQKFETDAQKAIEETNRDDVVAELFGGNAITQKSNIVTKRAVSDELAPMILPPLPTKASIYVFRTRLDVPLNDENSLVRTFKPEEEELCYGILTFFHDCSSNLPESPIFTRNGREVVHIDVLTDITVTRELWTMCTRFHAYLMKKVCRISKFDFDDSLAPVYVPVRSGVIDLGILRCIFLKAQANADLNAVVSKKVSKKGEKLSFFIREIMATESGTKLSLERIPKSVNFSKNVFNEKTKFREISSDERRAAFAVPLLSCELEFLTAPQWSKAQTVPVCTHRLNRLLIAERYRRTMVAAGIGCNSPDPWPPMIENCAPRVASPVKIAPKHLSVSEAEMVRGPSPSDILIALTPSSAQDFESSERFEVLGDSFLKLAITLHLFSERELSDEGKLTAERCRLSSNMNLLSLAMPKKLHEAVESRDFSMESFCPPGIVTSGEEARKVLHQQYKSKICADSVEAMIGVYLDKSGPVGALELLRFFGLPLGSGGNGDFLSRFDLSYDPTSGNPDTLGDALERHNDVLQRVEGILGYKFRNRMYLLEAITHRSYRGNDLTSSYERLEFLGDAVLDYLVSSFIFTNCTNFGPGQITAVRSALVCNNQFARIVIKTRLIGCLLHHAPSLARFAEASAQSSSGKGSGILDFTNAPKPFADFLESLIGAVFIDCGLKLAGTWDIFRRLATDQVLFGALDQDPRNPIVVLHEMFPSSCVYGKPIVREDDQIEMTLSVGTHRFNAIAQNKKAAKLALAKSALGVFSHSPSPV